MLPIRETAIVLRSVRYKERDQIVTGLTAHFGKISGLAKNSIQSRRFGDTLQLFSASDWIMTPPKEGSDLFLLTEAEPRKQFSKISKSYPKLVTASGFADVLSRITPERTQSQELFKVAAHAFLALDQSREESIPVLWSAFLLRVLATSGLLSPWDSCALCHLPHSASNTDYIRFDSHSLSWFCTQCQHQGKEFSFRCVQILKSWLETPMQNLAQENQASPETSRLVNRSFINLVPGFEKALPIGLTISDCTL